MQGGQAIVTHDTLRADLATMELRLRKEIAEDLQQKASSTHIARLESAISDLNRAISVLRDDALSPDRVKAIVSTALQDAHARGWTTRERLMGVVLFLMTLASFLLNLSSIRGG